MKSGPDRPRSVRHVTPPIRHTDPIRHTSKRPLPGDVTAVTDVTAPSSRRKPTTPKTTHRSEPTEGAALLTATDDQRLTLTVTEAAQLLGISRATAYECVRTGDLPSITLGRRILIPRSAFYELLADGRRTR